MPFEKKTTTVTHHELKFDKQELLSALCVAGWKIPSDCEITVRVPGGGDWSNTNLDIDANSPVSVTWTTRVSDNA